MHINILLSSTYNESANPAIVPGKAFPEMLRSIGKSFAHIVREPAIAHVRAAAPFDSAQGRPSAVPVRAKLDQHVPGPGRSSRPPTPTNLRGRQTETQPAAFTLAAFTVAHPSKLRLCSKRPRAEETFTVIRLVESESVVTPVSAQPQEITPPEVTLRNVIGRHIKPAIPFWPAAILAALSLWLYGPTIYHLVLQWAATDSDFSHGFFVPLFSAFVL